MNKITETTLIPLGIVLALLGGSGWLTKIYFQSEANAETIQKIETTLKEEKSIIIEHARDIRTELNQINLRLGRIEGKLEK